jgi:DNA-directed RNA polymerase subunit RPC12/RpoP
MPIELACKCGHKWTYKGKSEHYATCPRCHNLVNVKKATEAGGDTELTPEEIAVLDRADNEHTESAVTTKLPGTSCCGMWDKFYKCPDCGILFELFKSSRAPIICPCCESRSLKLYDT